MRLYEGEGGGLKTDVCERLASASPVVTPSASVFPDSSHPPPFPLFFSSSSYLWFQQQRSSMKIMSFEQVPALSCLRRSLPLPRAPPFSLPPSSSLLQPQAGEHAFSSIRRKTLRTFLFSGERDDGDDDGDVDDDDDDVDEAHETQER